MDRPDYETGFTLLELMVSLAILGFVLLGSLRIIAESHQMTQEARYRLLAGNAVRSILEEIKDTPLGQVNNLNPDVFVPGDLPNGDATIITNPANVSGVQLATVTVRITWRNPKNLPGLLEVSTMRSRF